MASDRRVLAALLCLSAIYLWQFVYEGWIPHDDGMLAQIAERVMAGEMPHRDFDDPSTGLLGYLHGLGLLIFGISPRSLRLVLFPFTLAWLPAIYVLARHSLRRGVRCRYGTGDDLDLAHYSPASRPTTTCFWRRLAWSRSCATSTPIGATGSLLRGCGADWRSSSSLPEGFISPLPPSCFLFAVSGRPYRMAPITCLRGARPRGFETRN